MEERMFSKKNCFYIGPSQKLDFCWLKNYAPGATVSWKGWVKNWGGVKIFKQILSRDFCRVLLWWGVADSQLQKFWPSECWRLGSAFHLSWWGSVQRRCWSLGSKPASGKHLPSWAQLLRAQICCLSCPCKCPSTDCENSCNFKGIT